MSEFKKEIGVAVAVALIAALSLGLLAVAVFPSGTSTNVDITGQIPKALLGYVYARNTSCSLSSSVCTFDIVNNSTAPLQLVACEVEVIISSNSSFTTWDGVVGKVDGPASSSIPASSSVAAICTFPSTKLAHVSEGFAANGLFTVRLIDNWFVYPAGDEPSFNFIGMWSA